MDRQKKYTHITARVNKISKLVSKHKLKYLCNYTLSEAYWRLDEGKGLLHIYDQESFNIWSDLMNQVANISSPAQLTKGQHEELSFERESIWSKMEKYRSWIDQGSTPIQLQSFASDRNIEIPFVQDAISYLAPDEFVISSLEINKILEVAQLFQDRYNSFIEDRIEKGEVKNLPRKKEVLNSTYQIRADYSKKKSDSEKIRYRLDGIWEVTPRTDYNHRNIFNENFGVIEEYVIWRKSKIKHELKSLLEFLHRIEISALAD